MGEYLQEQYRNSIKELNDVERKWRKNRLQKITKDLYVDWTPLYKKLDKLTTQGYERKIND